MRTRSKVLVPAALLVLISGAGVLYTRHFYEPGADPSFDTTVADPALVVTSPRVLFDHGHRNVHAIWGRYKPFAELLRADGCRVSSKNSALTERDLKDAEILVCVNAEGPKGARAAAAYTPEECDAVERWVTAGGALLLVADHHPCGPAMAALSAKFDVEMTGGWTDDPANARPGAGDPGQIVFSRDRGGVVDHPITRGRSDAERVNTIETFTGQSLVPPPRAAVLLPLADTAIDRVPKGSKSETQGGVTTTTFETDDRPAAGHCQALALRHGKGRVVVLAEAAMISAQEDKGRKFGMNAPGNDNRLFTLNVVRWLAGSLGD